MAVLAVARRAPGRPILLISLAPRTCFGDAQN
jgi:hypothetical protein